MNISQEQSMLEVIDALTAGLLRKQASCEQKCAAKHFFLVEMLL